MTTTSDTEFTALPGDREIVMTRVFDAPPSRVFTAYTDPDCIVQWWGPKKYRTEIEAMEVKHGGRWRFISHGDGEQHCFRGVYHEVIENERLTQTFEYEGTPGRIALETAIFQELSGKTRLITKAVFQSVDDRDGMVSSGMESGATEGFDRLSELLERMRD